MKVFIDTSALAKRYVHEPGSERLQQLLSQTGRVASSTLCIPEMSAALNRLRHRHRISSEDCASIKERFETDLEHIELIPQTDEVIRQHRNITESQPDATAASHIACARTWEPDTFVTADPRQLVSARSALSCPVRGLGTDRPD